MHRPGWLRFSVLSPFSVPTIAMLSFSFFFFSPIRNLLLGNVQFRRCLLVCHRCQEAETTDRRLRSANDSRAINLPRHRFPTHLARLISRGTIVYSSQTTLTLPSSFFLPTTGNCPSTVEEDTTDNYGPSYGLISSAFIAN